MLITLVILRFYSKSKFYQFIKDSRLEISILAVAIALGLVANTLPQSFNGVSFYSAIILFRLSRCLPYKSVDVHRWNTIITVLGIIIVGIHQARIVYATRNIQHVTQAFIQNFINSYDGVVATHDLNISSDVKPFVSSLFNSKVQWWNIHVIEIIYGKKIKSLRILNNLDSEVYSEVDSFTKNHISQARLNGGIAGSKYIWFPNDFAPEIGDTVQITSQPVKLSKFHRLIMLLSGNTPPPDNDGKKTMIVTESDILQSHNRNWTGLKINPDEIKTIQFARH